MTLAEVKKLNLSCEIDLPLQDNEKFHNTDILSGAKHLSSSEPGSIAFAISQIAVLDFEQKKLHNSDDLAANKKLAENKFADEESFAATQIASENFVIDKILPPL